MSKHWITHVLAAAVLLAGLGWSTALAEERMELTVNGDMEADVAEDGTIPCWHPSRHANVKEAVRIVEDNPHGGKRCLQWRYDPAPPAKFCQLSHNLPHTKKDRLASWWGGKALYVPILYPDVPVRVSYWARGKGDLRMLLVLRRYVRFYGSQWLNTGRLTPEWKRYTRDIRLPLGTVMNEVCPLVRFYGSPGDEAFIDDFSISCARTPETEALYEPRSPVRVQRIAVKGAAHSICLNGEPLKGGAGELSLGQNDLLIELTPQGGGPVTVSGEFLIPAGTMPLVPGTDAIMPVAPVPPLSETKLSVYDGSWRLSADRQEAFRRDGYEPAKWRGLPSDKAGQVVLSAEEAGKGPLYLRRTVYWAGPRDVFLWPDLREFHVAEGGLSLIMFHLRLPVPTHPKDSPAVEIEMPAEMEVLDKTEDGVSQTSSNIVVKPETTLFKRNGRPYRRYVYRPPAAWWHYEPTKHGTISCFNPLPLYVTLPRSPADTEGHVMRIRRVLRGGNATELWRELPIRFLPPTPGGKPKNFRLSWRAEELWYHRNNQRKELHMSRPERYQGLAACAGAGPGIFWPHRDDMEFKAAVEKLREEGLNAMLQLPIGNPGGYAGSAIWQGYFKEHPEFGTVYYTGTPESLLKGGACAMAVDWARAGKPGPKSRWCYRGYCPTHLAEGGEEAWRRFEDYVAKMKKDWPTGSFIHEEHGTHLLGSSCFCERCKASFERFSGIKGAARMSDDEIASKHLPKWREFLIHQIYQLRLRARNTLNKHGVFYFMHDEGQQGINYDVELAMVGAVDGIDSRANPNPGRERTPLGDGRFAQMLRRGRKSNCSLAASVYGYDGAQPRRWKNICMRAAIMSRSGVFKFETPAMVVAAGGGLAYLSQATQLIEKVEPFILEGEPTGDMFECKGFGSIAYRKGGEAVVFIFNDWPVERACTLVYKGDGAGMTAQVVGRPGKLDPAAPMKVAVPRNDVVAVHLRRGQM